MEARSIIYTTTKRATPREIGVKPNGKIKDDWDEGRRVWGGGGQARKTYRENHSRGRRRGSWDRKEGRCRRRRDRPEFVQLGESVSSGITSHNGQTQTEERKMDVRGCTKGKGEGEGGEEGWLGGRRHHQRSRVWRVRVDRKESEGREGDTTQQYNTTMTKTTSTEHTNKIIEYTKNTQTPPWGQWEVKIEQKGCEAGGGWGREAKSLVIRSQREREGERFCALKGKKELKQERDVNVPNQIETWDLSAGRWGKEEEEERGEGEEVYKEKWMSLEPAWGNCGETAWKSNMNGKKRGKKKKEKLKAQSSEHTKERRLPHTVSPRERSNWQKIETSPG